MPKMKTDRGAAKRFKITGHRQAAPRPGVPQPPAREEVVHPHPASGSGGDVAPADRKAVKRLLGI